jgi:hypothetical protein
VCALAVITALLPATAFGQAAVDEYTLDIPGASGTNPGDPTAPTAAASGSGGGATGQGSGGRGKEETASRSELASGTSDAASDNLNLSSLQKGSGHSALPTSSRSAPEVVADSLTSSSMLPIVAALVLITGVGAWRLVRSRRSGLTGVPS